MTDPQRPISFKSSFHCTVSKFDVSIYVPLKSVLEAKLTEYTLLQTSISETWHFSCVKHFYGVSRNMCNSRVMCYHILLLKSLNVQVRGEENTTPIRAGTLLTNASYHLTSHVCERAGEMIQWLRSLTTLLEVLSSNPWNHMVAHNHL